VADGFLSRWSRRKLDVKEGRAPAPSAPPVPVPPGAHAAPDAVQAPARVQPLAPASLAADPLQAPPMGPEAAPADLAPAEAAAPAAPVHAAAAEGPPPPPTLDDVARLGIESDFSRFVAPDVSAEVKNAAMKKLFADPRFNVMDGLDVYIDDYSQPDPIPESMVRKLAASQFLKLFEEVPKEAEIQSPATALANDCSVSKGAEFVAQSAPSREEASAHPSHADPDLRLQQDDAPPGEDPGPGDR